MEQEQSLIAFPKLALKYALALTKRPWPEFESQINLSRLGPEGATDYAIMLKQSRWLRAEKVIGRSRDARSEYGSAFGFEFPEPGKKPSQSAASKAEYLNRDLEWERSKEHQPGTISRYLDAIAKAARRNPDKRREQLQSFFQWEPAEPCSWELRLARGLTGKLRERTPALEAAIARHPELSLHYAHSVLRRRWPAGEQAISRDPSASYTYAKEIVKERWFAGEPTIRLYDFYWALYCRRFDVRD